jgi:hypothetical protein
MLKLLNDRTSRFSYAYRIKTKLKISVILVNRESSQQVDYCLKKFDLEFPHIEYPEVLEKYLGRKVWKDTINNINKNPSLWGNFVKPIKEKAFTGKVINGPKDLIGCGSCYEDLEVLVSEPLNIVYELRGLVYYDKLVDLRPYKGSWKFMSKLDTSY